MIMQKTLFVGALATLSVASVAATAAPAFAASLVVPNSLDGAPGNTFANFLNVDSRGSSRMQQVYASSQFSAITSPIFITEISFRPPAASGGTTGGSAFGPTTINDVLINLSTTSAKPTSGAGALLSAFASNIGADETTVFNGDLTISSSNTVVNPDNNLRAFDISIALTTPFLYDPTLGNLLLDIRNPSGGFTSNLDTEQGPTGVGIFYRRLSISNINKTAVDAENGQLLSGGVITQFGYRPVPTPALLPGLIGMGVAALRKRRSQGEGDESLS